jgi:cobalt-zinc-cadmium efflux system protein
MHHRHSHDSSSGRTLYIAASLTLLYALVEAGAGWLYGSLALVSDAGHMLTDTSALLIASLGTWLSYRQPSKLHSYGLGRAEFVAALINGILMLVIIGSIAVHAIERLSSPVTVKGEAVTIVAIIGLLINLLVLKLLGHGEHNLNRRAAILHVISDMLASIAAIASGIIIVFTGWTLVDPVLSLVIAAIILASTLRLLRETIHGLMEGVPLGLSLEKVGMDLAAADGVTSVHDLHIWSLSSRVVALSAHIVIPDMNDWERIRASLNILLHDRYGIDHVTLQPEPSSHELLYQLPQDRKS